MSFELDQIAIEAAGQILTAQCHGLAHASGWWTDLKTGADLRAGTHADPLDQPAKKNVGELL